MRSGGGDIRSGRLHGGAEQHRRRVIPSRLLRADITNPASGIIRRDHRRETGVSERWIDGAKNTLVRPGPDIHPALTCKQPERVPGSDAGPAPGLEQIARQILEIDGVKMIRGQIFHVIRDPEAANPIRGHGVTDVHRVRPRQRNIPVVSGAAPGQAMRLPGMSRRVQSTSHNANELVRQRPDIKCRGPAICGHFAFPLVVRQSWPRYSALSKVQEPTIAH